MEVRDTTPEIRSPTPETSSCSSDSDSVEEQNGYDETMRNYMSEDSESDKEGPPDHIEKTYEPIETEMRKAK